MGVAIANEAQDGFTRGLLSSYKELLSLKRHCYRTGPVSIKEKMVSL